MIFLGLDPGQSGALAVLWPDGRAAAYPWPATERDVYDLLHEHAGVGQLGICAAIEDVHSFPGQGVSSTFKFGRHYGMLRAFLISLGIVFEAAQPHVWQRAFGFPRKACGATAKKNAHKARAQELFPACKVTHATADALLIAEWLRARARS